MNSIILPKWQQLPELELYLDQVLLYVNQVTASSLESKRALTASMINNYVKQGYMSKPIKKKYGKQQIARLIAITILKNSFSIQEISQVLESFQAEQSSPDLYDTFVTVWNNDQENDAETIIIFACKTVKYYFQTLALSKERREEKE
ncbi:hypothetical protein A9Q68_02520 [Streptococcus bovimastitidis]|uniref:DUF1836 domain-containing protein n=1 Tax=Streptococcus bovimastitidis TaxID=1856638 RepID=A0A1L8MP37_9STRE|nr:DUF1836 domain-containing protein [Streptococcus bovimastitidis]OJF72435.1 hypothetical protein A9Q68_02520 [Streptococcus bovimastitidis]